MYLIKFLVYKYHIWSLNQDWLKKKGVKRMEKQDPMWRCVSFTKPTDHSDK